MEKLLHLHSSYHVRTGNLKSQISNSHLPDQPSLEGTGGWDLGRSEYHL